MEQKFLLQDFTNVTISINIGDLKDAINYCISKTKEEFEQLITDANTETYPSVEKVAQILDVNKSTLWRWKRSGYLVPIEVGGKRRYRMSDVSKILEGRI